jgi:hypothetical protein
MTLVNLTEDHTATGDAVMHQNLTRAVRGSV